MGIVERTRPHFNGGLMISIPGEDPKAFELKLNEMKRTLMHLNAAHQRLFFANRHENHGPVGGDIRVMSDRMESELATLNGWVLTLVQNLFSLVWIELGSDDQNKLIKEWKKAL
jgi:hypothetical protein